MGSHWRNVKQCVLRKTILVRSVKNFSRPFLTLTIATERDEFAASCIKGVIPYWDSPVMISPFYKVQFSTCR